MLGEVGTNMIKNVYKELRFDMAQTIMKRDRVGTLSKRDSCSTQSEKENNEMNENY